MKNLIIVLIVYLQIQKLFLVLESKIKSFIQKQNPIWYDYFINNQKCLQHTWRY